VSYDITSNKLRRKIEKTLKNFGQRMQKSVFLCGLAAEQLARLIEALQHVLTQWNALQESSDSIILTGPLLENNINFLLGNSCILQDYVIY
jgi:CRISPR-associated endonuclease Cas2